MLEEIKLKQEERKINETLARICKDLDSFSAKISDCISKEVELPQIEVEKIHELNVEYNAEFEKFKKLKGIK